MFETYVRTNALVVVLIWISIYTSTVVTIPNELGFIVSPISVSRKYDHSCEQLSLQKSKTIFYSYCFRVLDNRVKISSTKSVDEFDSQKSPNSLVEDEPTSLLATALPTTSPPTIGDVAKDTIWFDDDEEETETNSRRNRIRKRISEWAQTIALKNTRKRASNAAMLAMPQAVAAVIKDATLNAVEIAMEEMMRSSSKSSRYKDDANSYKRKNAFPAISGSSIPDIETYLTTLIDEAFLPMEKSLDEMDLSLQQARQALVNAKKQAKVAVQEIQKATTTLAPSSNVNQRITSTGTTSSITTNITTMNEHEIDYSTSEMAPPFLDEDQCLVPGEPVVRVEKAPENSRRIFAGIDIFASVDTVWNVLTNYSNLQNVVPNLVVNEVLELYNYDTELTNTTGGSDIPEIMMNIVSTNDSIPEEEQCRILCQQMKGSMLRQVGGAKVAGIQFSARTTLEVREWPNGMPDFAHFHPNVYNGVNRNNRATALTKIPLQRYRFPRPFAISSLPTKDISMQSIDNDDGEFRIYQGVWRMQPLPGCAPPGQEAMRLTYAVQISPRSYVPVGLIENRIVRDLCTNLIAIRDYVTTIKKDNTVKLQTQ